MYLIVAALGILAIAAGIVTLAFGIPINEFNLGTALIVAGTTLIAAGLILVGLAAAVHQLGQIALALRPRAPARPVTQPQAAEQAAPVAARPVQAPVPASPQPPQVAQMVPQPGPVRPPMPAPQPRAPAFARPRAEERSGQAAPAASEPAAPFSAIERLRSSLTRADRRPSEEVEDAADTPYAQSVSAPTAPPGPGPASREANRGVNPGTNGAAPAIAAEATKKPALDFLFRSKARDPQPEPFDAVWPRRGQRRPDEATEEDPSARPAAAEAPIDRPAPAPVAPPAASESYAAAEPDEMRPAAILKSGVVDGMAYTLYADGSIEAQLPQGTVRFGSIAELRAHIENNS
jgi:hypothetical protein